MPRNNQGRLDNKPETGADAPPQNANALLNFVTPTEFVELPTKGKFYSQNHPLKDAETVEIKFMTAKETDLLTSKTLLKKGVAIDRMIESVLVDKSIKVRDLFIGDKNSILIAARISGFGASYDANITCKNCGQVGEQHFNLQEVVRKEVDDDIEFTENGTFFVDLPSSKIRAECKLLTGADEDWLMKKVEKKRKLKLAESLLTDQLKLIIVSLEGVTERGPVENFVDVMPAKDSNYLRKEYDRLKPDIDLSYLFECESCDASNTVNIPFSTNFFWPE
jgi:hypothetical protein